MMTLLLMVTWCECTESGGDSGGVMSGSVHVRCVIERADLPASSTTSSSSVVDSTTPVVAPAAAELSDSVAAVPASLPFHELPQFILVARGYSTAEALACRGIYALTYNFYFRRLGR